jgi:hypothetical protein
MCVYIACTRVKTHALQYLITRGRGSGGSEEGEEGGACYPLPFPPPASRACPSPVSPGASPRDLFPVRGLRGASDVAPDKKSSQDEPESPTAPEATGEPECPCCSFPPAAACVAGANCGHSNVSGGGARKSNSGSEPTPLPPAGPNTFANRSSVLGPKWGCVIRGGCRGDP